jgi:thiamine phosphate phosphatase / amino-HMP aminohydrolase
MSAMARPSRKTAKHLILDWDGTLTVKDTMSVLAELPNARNERLRKTCPDSVPPGDPKTQWNAIVEGYMNDSNAHKREEDFPNEYPDTPGGLESWLESLKGVEYASARRAEKSGFFRGVKAEDIESTVRKAFATGALKLRPGWEQLIGFAVRPNASSGDKVSIISVNWSESFIRWALYIAAERMENQPDKQRLCEYINNMHIHANEIHGLPSPLGSSGRLISRVRTAEEKKLAMEEAISQHHDSLPRGQDFFGPFTFYVGDSATDFMCFTYRYLDGRGFWIYDAPADAPAGQEWREEFEKTFKPLSYDRFEQSFEKICHFVAVRDLGEVFEKVVAFDGLG